MRLYMCRGSGNETVYTCRGSGNETVYMCRGSGNEAVHVQGAGMSCPCLVNLYTESIYTHAGRC